jgi:hypothetical protein
LSRFQTRSKAQSSPPARFTSHWSEGSHNNQNQNQNHLHSFLYKTLRGARPGVSSSTR